MKPSAAPCWPTEASHFHLRAAESTDHSSYYNLHLLTASSYSVEALASAFVPVAVDHQANDYEEDATQHGEEHGEENSYATHPFLSLAH